MTAPPPLHPQFLAAAPAVPWYLAYPFLSAALYALGSIFIKRSITDGVRPTHVFHVTNFGVGVVTVPLIFIGASEARWDLLWVPFLMSVCFFAAAWCTVAAMRHGDVSLVTPVMGTKVVFVAIGSMLFVKSALPGALILAAVLTAAGIFVLGLPDMMRRNVKLNGSIGFALLSAGLFAICDLMVQTWAPVFGRFAFIGIGSCTVSLFSVIMILFRKRGPGAAPALPSGKPARWLWTGAMLTGVQAVILGYSLATFHDATGINVLYSSRGLWAIFLVWLVGPLLGNRERHGLGRTYLWRVAGGVMLTVAIVLAVMARSMPTHLHG